VHIQQVIVIVGEIAVVLVVYSDCQLYCSSIQ
jgi:hypothetical protein